ncbi:MAG: NAD(P)(+) transhydrogenase (Re/Si-specific) subunit alpha, partial [Oceanibaculum nanhaiense]|nr:NAD(P)(+) transhydrogenase (Re/Si-specific) subunit alpha [Oceanibaculum nanhaiense]
MIVAIPKERRPGETRVAASPDTVKKLIDLGLDVVVEKGAGQAAAMTDEAYKAAGATIAKDTKSALEKADIVLKVQRPTGSDDKTDEVALLKEGAVLLCILNAYNDRPLLDQLAARKIATFGMEFVPRITRAQ